MSTNYIAPIWRMPRNANNVADRLSNYSINFDGSTNYIEIADNILSGLEKFSISVWYNANSLTNDRAILGAWSASVTQMLLYWDDNNDVPPTGVGWRFLMNDGFTSSDVVWGRATTTNEWHHIVVTFDGSTISFYHDNGTPVTDAGSGPIRNQTAAWRIGVDTSSTRYWDGELSQFCLFDYALSTEQVEYLYDLNSPMVPGAVNLTAPIFYNQIGDNSNPNTLPGYPNTSVEADSVFNFNGSSTWINVPDNDLLSFGGTSDSPFSMSAWIKTTAYGDGIISRWGNTSGSGSTVVGYEYILYVQRTSSTATTARLRLALYDQGTGTPTTSNVQRRDSVTIINTGEWVHVVATYDGRGGNGTSTNTANLGITMYINGVPESSYINQSGGSYFNMRNSNRPTEIGVYNDTSSVVFNGEISNAQIWDEELTAPQALELYNNGQPLMTGTQPQEANLRAWWKLNQTANWEADTVGEWQIPDTRSAYPQSFDFVPNETIRIIDTAPAPISLNDIGNENSYTVAGWIKTISTSTGGGSWFSNDTFIDFRQQKGSGAHVPFSIGMDNGEVSFGRSPNYTGSAEKFFSTGTINDGNWHHIAFTVNVNSLKIYIDGSLDSSHTFTVAIGDCSVSTLNSNLQLGARSTDVGGLTSYAAGKYSNFQIWDTELIDTEIQTLYNSGVPLTGTQPQEANLKAWYKLDNTATFSTDWSIPDASGNGNTGTSSLMTEQNLVNNNVSVLNGESTGMNTTNLVQSNLTRTQPFSSYSYSLDGGTEYWTAGTTLGDSLGNAYTGPLSVSIWINTGDINQEQGIFSLCKDNATLDELSISLNYDFGWYWTLNANGNDAYVAIGSAPITAGAWHHLLCTFEPSGMKLYIDGQQISLSGTTTYTNLDLTGTTTLIGGYYQIGAKEFLGNLSNCAVWNQILTQDDALNLYNNGVPQDLNNFRVNPIRWWSLDENYSYWDGSNIIGRDDISGDDATGINIAQIDLEGNAPGSNANGTGVSLDIDNLKGDMKDSKINAFSINMADYADGVTNPAASGRSTEIP